ncbi:MAG TPA: hypothetical protein VE866_04755 [Candidatus Binatia bacterium]|nr:hypothetical protein [Candidatus Binatia bacterium]
MQPTLFDFPHALTEKSPSPPLVMKGISLRSPWWWFILYGGKDVENRHRRFNRTVRGRVLLHASLWFNAEEIVFDAEDARAMQAKKPYRAKGAPTLTLGYLRQFRGCIVGSVEVVDYVDESDSPWFVGETGIILRNPIAFEIPLPCKGALGYFDVDVSTPEFRKQLNIAA